MNIDSSLVIKAVTYASDAYESALLANDIDGLNHWFWNDPRVNRWGINETLSGYEAIQDFRQNRSLEGLARTVLHRQIVTFDASTALVMVAFKRELDGKLGRQSQTWVCFPEGWRIVMAHISLAPEEP